jgi:two-component system sensor histidine kinase YesM
MKQRLHNLLDKFGHLLKKRSLQFTLSLTFTLVAIAGMIVVTLTLSTRFTKTNEKNDF